MEIEAAGDMSKKAMHYDYDGKSPLEYVQETMSQLQSMLRQTPSSALAQCVRMDGGNQVADGFSESDWVVIKSRVDLSIDALDTEMAISGAAQQRDG